ncbi:MAG: IS1634 family transposase [Symploca sp. SIO3C6]|nr:IS1634 family transposase [Symploca sp. SIO3C6]
MIAHLNKAIAASELTTNAEYSPAKLPESRKQFSIPRPLPSAQPLEMPEGTMALESAKSMKFQQLLFIKNSSSFSVSGEYSQSQRAEREVLNIFDGRNPIKITQGYSRDHRPDLKQFMMDLIVSGDGDVPLLMRVGSGNETDKVVFGKILAQFKKQVRLESLMIADSALYSKDNLKLIEKINWLCRVPLTIKEAKQLVNEIESSALVASTISGYSFREIKSIISCHLLAKAING